MVFDRWSYGPRSDESARPGGEAATYTIHTPTPYRAGLSVSDMPSCSSTAGEHGTTLDTVGTGAAPQLLLQVDGAASRPGSTIAGVGIVVRNTHGHVLLWRSLRTHAQTNNEAEYQAIIAGLGLMLRHYPHVAVRCVSDSESVVAQIRGQSAIRAPSHQPLHARALALAQQFCRVEFVVIGREYNRLADALAWEALYGRGALLSAIKRRLSCS